MEVKAGSPGGKGDATQEHVESQSGINIAHPQNHQR